MRYYARLEETEYECTLEEEDGVTFVTIEGKRYRADLNHIARTQAFSLLLDGASFEFTVNEQEEDIELSGGAGHFHISVEDARTHAARAKTAGARMPGIVRELKVAVGDNIEKGEPLLILEAMKMQNDIRSDRAGVIKALHIAAGDTVDKGAKLVDIE